MLDNYVPGNEMLLFFPQLYNIFPSIMERLPGPHQTVFAGIEEIRDFVRIKIDEHKATLDPSSPRDFIDCFLIRADQVVKIMNFPCKLKVNWIILPLLLTLQGETSLCK